MKFKSLTTEQKQILEEELKKAINEQIVNIMHIVNIAEELGFTNKQWFLNYEDFLNSVSVKDHN